MHLPQAAVLALSMLGPLTLVPSPSAAAARDGIAPVADTYVVTESPGSTYGSATKLAASNWSTPWHSQAYLRFSVPAPPAGRSIASARLELLYQKTTQQASVTELHAVADNTWPESMTYTDRPALGPVVATVTLPEAGATSLSFDVSGTVRTAGTYSFAMTNPTAQSATVVHSREAGDLGPRLVVTYTQQAQPTLCGASFIQEGSETYQQALAREDALFGGLKAVRVFYGGLPQSWPGKLDAGGRPMVISFKASPRDIIAGTHDAAMRAWFRGAPAGQDIYWTFYHEPEDNIAKGEFSAADYRAAWQHLTALSREAANPRLRATLILMGWTVDPASGRDWRDYYPGRGALDVLAWDIYNYDSKAAKGEYLDAGFLLDASLAVNRAEGLPYGVAELGSHIAAGDDGTGRAAWLSRMTAHLSDNDALWALYFDIDWSSGDYRLRDPDGRAVWTAFCA
ncbi:DNRLRE domain-containing protein [Nonomuraea phyllanthi]|uniref:DNRLRE domain-containing protein n=1 Tax=Nonomuraea phyllanthi TaxID=2219224 RepID=A0A5C4WJK7_9ACTN|nr:DNRLRE domain-containing protein [Nonomuraea phyllanthi]KAB8194633.1 DNRLRE domain-containing protein [Nonomuraea phyllanthi]